MFEGIEDRCLEAMQKVYVLYKSSPNATRSSKLTKILHGWVQDEIRKALGDEYEIVGQSLTTGSEKKIQGMYYSKNVDVCVKRAGRDLGVISVKFVRSNYRQNSVNYFENQMGETANLRQNNIVFGHLMLLTDPIPYNKKTGKQSRTERINNQDVLKYRALSDDHIHAHAPNVQAMCIAKLDETGDRILRICTQQDLDQISNEAWSAITGPLDLKGFFVRFVNAVENQHIQLRH